MTPPYDVTMTSYDNFMTAVGLTAVASDHHLTTMCIVTSYGITSHDLMTLHCITFINVT